ncbi:LOW QUALITY PROTEIN: hypothetical protein MXB_1741 [Myxobolus squamalis]|nr:LOW QUALITY PROTEIN: hypothetical protein MXB_1741 [Myxobolus squamalis]
MAMFSKELSHIKILYIGFANKKILILYTKRETYNKLIGSHFHALNINYKYEVQFKNQINASQYMIYF